MATHDPSVADVLRSALHDAQDLVRGEIALAKAEARQEVARFGMAAVLLAAAAVLAVLGLVLLMTTAAWAIAEGLGWPVWSGFGIVTLVTMLAAGALAYVGRRRMAVGRHMPRTVDTMKEHMRWMRARTS